MEGISIPLVPKGNHTIKFDRNKTSSEIREILPISPLHTGSSASKNKIRQAMIAKIDRKLIIVRTKAIPARELEMKGAQRCWPLLKGGCISRPNANRPPYSHYVGIGLHNHNLTGSVRL